jgi:hypothetical protein
MCHTIYHCLLTPLPPPPHPQCPLAVAQEFLARLELAEVFFDRKHDKCYCGICYKAEWPDVIKSDGPNPYVVPRGWVRFGLQLPPRALALGKKFFNEWSVSFHGAAEAVCKSILHTGGMLIPGDKLIDGSVLRSGRCAGRQDRVYYTSPTVRYAGLRFYATPTRFTDSTGRVMLGQVQRAGGWELRRSVLWRIDCGQGGFERAWGVCCGAPGGLGRISSVVMC